MIFTQPIFLLFFAVCFVVHWALNNHMAQKWWLLACSYFFYGYWDWRFLALIFAPGEDILMLQPVPLTWEQYTGSL